MSKVGVCAAAADVLLMPPPPVMTVRRAAAAAADSMARECKPGGYFSNPGLRV